MYVPNYIPPPVEVPNNVTQERYGVKLEFIRRVAVLHLLSLGVVGAVSCVQIFSVPIQFSLIEAGIVLLILSLVRIATRATRMDLILSLAIMPFLVVLLSCVVRSLQSMGWPIWGVVVGAACSAIYSLCCGRDFSFVGQFMLSLIVSSVILAIAATSMAMAPGQAAFLLGSNAAFLVYFVYDSASLLARRRVGEEAAAIVDLYRDVFNIFGYLVRVARHWRKHRIWAR